MKKLFCILLTLVLCVAIAVPVVAAPQPISSEVVELTVQDSQTRNIVTGDFTLNTYYYNGVTMFTFDVEDPDFRMAAMQYLMGRSGDPTHGGYLPLPRQASGYQNDTRSDGSATAYAWKNLIESAPRVIEGGQSAGWFGTGTANSIVLHQRIVVTPSSGFERTDRIIHPAGNTVSNDRLSSTWRSPTHTNTNIAGASGTTLQFPRSYLGQGSINTVSFTEGGDITINNRTHRPSTFIRYNNGWGL